MWLVKGMLSPYMLACFEAARELFSESPQRCRRRISMLPHEPVHFFTRHLTDVVPSIFDGEKAQHMFNVFHLAIGKCLMVLDLHLLPQERSCREVDKKVIQ